MCEVLSPSTEWLDRDMKLRVYAAAGVGHVWLVDPLASSLKVLRRTGASWARVACAEPFEDLGVHPALLWDDEEA